MKTPKLSIALLPLLLSLPLRADDINPALRNIRDYPDTPHFDNALNNIPAVRTQPPITIHSTKHNYILMSPPTYPSTPFDPKSLKLNLDLPAFPQVNPAPLYQLLTPPAPSLVTPSTIPATTPKK